MAHSVTLIGGIRRQFFSVVFEKIGASDKSRIFEGPPTGRRPVFRVSNLSSGLLKVIGKIVGHSFLMDGQGFPYICHSAATIICVVVMLYNLYNIIYY